MRAGLIVTGVLGFGTALVFAAAAITAMLFPNGTLVSPGMNGVMFDRGFVGGGVAVPMPAPAIDVGPPVTVTATDGGFQGLPGDVVVPDDGSTVEVTPAP